MEDSYMNSQGPHREAPQRSIAKPSIWNPLQELHEVPYVEPSKGALWSLLQEPMGSSTKPPVV